MGHRQVQLLLVQSSWHWLSPEPAFSSLGFRLSLRPLFKRTQWKSMLLHAGKIKDLSNSLVSNTITGQEIWTGLCAVIDGLENHWCKRYHGSTNCRCTDSCPMILSSHSAPQESEAICIQRFVCFKAPNEWVKGLIATSMVYGLASNHVARYLPCHKISYKYTLERLCY